MLVACGGRAPSFVAMPAPPDACPSRDEVEQHGLADVADDYELVTAAGLAGLSDEARYTLLVDVLPRSIVRLEEVAPHSGVASWTLACAYAAYADLGAELAPPEGSTKAEARMWRIGVERDVYPRFRGVRALADRHARAALEREPDAAWAPRARALLDALGVPNAPGPTQAAAP